jgi:hypothetical protein
VLIDNLPGMPDGVDAADGGFWISLVAPAPPFKPLLLSKALINPLVRALYARLRPGLKPWGAVVKVGWFVRACLLQSSSTCRTLYCKHAWLCLQA